MMNLSTIGSSTTTMATTTIGGGGGGGETCVPGEPSQAVTVSPDILILINSFYPLKVIHREEVAFKVTFYVLAMLLDVLGNSLVIFIVAASKKMRTPTNVLLVNLAVADLLIGLLCMWVHLGDSISQDWPFGLGICKVNMFAQITMITSSVLSLTVISIERFLAIVFPLRRGGWTLRMTFLIIVIIWVIACGIASPQLHVRYLEEYRFRDRHVIRCKERWDAVYLNQQCETWKPHEIWYHVFVGVVMFFVPIVVMIVCYTVICVSLLTRKAPGGGQASDSQSRSKRRVVRMLVILLVVFVVCWTPAHVLELIPYFDKEHKIDGTVSYIALYIGYLNSALNPVLYAGFNDNFRRGFEEVFTGGFLKKVGSRVRPEVQRTSTNTPARGRVGDVKKNPETAATTAATTAQSATTAVTTAPSATIAATTALSATTTVTATTSAPWTTAATATATTVETSLTPHVYSDRSGTLNDPNGVDMKYNGNSTRLPTTATSTTSFITT